MTFLSEPPQGLPFDVNREWRQRAPKGCRNPKKLRVDYWKKYNNAEIPLRSRQDWYKLALKLAGEASTPEELERGFEAEYYNELRKQLELARVVCKKGRDGDSYNLQRATAEILDEKALASLLRLCSCLLYGWAEPDRSKTDMAQEEEAYHHRALQDPSLPLPSETQHISLTRDGEDEDTSDNDSDSELDFEVDEFSPYEAPAISNHGCDAVGQLKRLHSAYSTNAAAAAEEENTHAEPALSAAGTLGGAHAHAKRDTASSPSQPWTLPAEPSKREPSSNTTAAARPSRGERVVLFP
ncbi:hypothetical protein MY11210_004603 [Beauveria gryllotalpidicola]